MQDGKHVILCIDDDDDVLATLEIILEKNNYKIVKAPTAEDGLIQFKATNPELIIVDLMMEEVDSGNTFVKDIRASGSSVPIYMLSSVGDQLTQTTNFSELGLAGVFQKPIDPDNLLKVLKRKLEA